MDAYNFRVDDSNPYEYEFYSNDIYEASPVLLRKVVRAYSYLGPTSYLVAYGRATVSYNTGTESGYRLGAVYQIGSPTITEFARLADWSTWGWDVSSKEALKAEIIDWYTVAMSQESLIDSYKEIFGDDYLDLDYNLILYWGYPLNSDGSNFTYPIALDCLYIGNTPLYDEIVSV